MTTTTHAVALTVHAWARVCGLTCQEMRDLLETMKQDTIVRIGDRIALDPTFVARFATAFGAFDDLELDADRDDDELDTGGRVGIENRQNPHGYTAQFSRERCVSLTRGAS